MRFTRESQGLSPPSTRRRINPAEPEAEIKLTRASPLPLFSLWSFVALIALMTLEILPATGPLLADAGAAFVAGWLVHVCLLALLVDALGGRLPRAVVLMPMVSYAGYYVARWEQDSHLQLAAEHLIDTNPGRIFMFDPQKFSLVMKAANSFVLTHAIPIVFSRTQSDRSDTYTAFRTVSKQHAVLTSQTSFPGDQGSAGVAESARTILTVTVTENPGEGWGSWNIGEQTTSIESDGKTIGVYRSAYALRLPILPFLTIGCTFSSDGGSRRCEANFVSRRTPIESRPRSINPELYDDPVSVMLGIRKYSAQETAELKTSVADIVLSRSGSRTSPREDAAFAMLEDVIHGREPEGSWTLGGIVAQNAARLAPLAGAMAKRFVELSRADRPDAPGRRQRLAFLAMGISALESVDFASVQDQFANLLGKVISWDSYPLLYVRLGDAGPETFAFYRDRFLSKDAGREEDLLTALAICRTGMADSELISEIKARILEDSGDEQRTIAYRSALLIALNKFGQGDPATELSEPPLLRAWYDSVLAGQGRTAVGPNNCMPTEWPVNEDVPPVMASGLGWVRQRWEPRLRSLTGSIQARSD